MCLVIFVGLLQVGPALALSGYGSDQPAVNAQYPDAAGSDLSGPGGGSATLSSLMRSDRRSADRDRTVAHRRSIQREIVRKATAVLSRDAGLGPAESGTVLLLLITAAVVSIGGFLRWRRGTTVV